MSAVPSADEHESSTLIRQSSRFESSAQGFDSERRRVLLTRGKPFNRVDDFPSRDARRLLQRHSFNHFSEHGTAHERRRAAVSQKARRLYASITQAQRQSQSIAAHGIRLFRYSRSVRQLPGPSRVGEVIFERIGVRQVEVFSYAVPVSPAVLICLKSSV